MCVCAKESAAKRYNLKSIDIAILREKGQRYGSGHTYTAQIHADASKKWTTKLEEANIEHDGIKRRRREKC